MNGGAGWLIPVASLSAAAQARYEKDARLAPPIQPALPAIVEHEEYLTLMEAYDKRPANLKRMAEARAAAVDAFNELRNAGLPVRMAEQQVMASNGASKATLNRYRAAVEGHDRQYWEALLCPRYEGGRGKTHMSPEAYEAIRRDFFIESQPPLTAILARIRKEATTRGWVIPSDKTVMNRLKAEPPHFWTYRQGGKKALERSFPTVERSYAKLDIHECWESDGRRADVWCKWPDGTIGRPVAIAWREVRTRMPLAIGIYKNEDAELVITAFCRALDLTGTRPKFAKIDNGRSYANKQLTGQQQNRYRFKVQPDERVGLMTRIGTRVNWSKPGRGRDKPIESWWGTIANHCDKLPQFAGAYCGRNPVEKPDNFDPRNSVPVEDYADALKAATWAFATRKGHRGEGMMGMSPLDLYNQLSADHQPQPVDPAVLRLGLMGVATVKPDLQDAKLTISVDGYGKLRYWSEALADLPKQVRARKLHAYFDPGAPRTVAVYDGEKYLCDAACIDKIDFHDEGGEKVRAHLKAKADYLRPRHADIKALKGGSNHLAPPTPPPPLMAFFDARLAAKPLPQPSQNQDQDDPIKPHPTEPGAHINAETGEVYRGKVVPLRPPVNHEQEEMTEEEIEALARRQRERNLPAYLREQP
ncbi:MAG: transposase domain-containing protein [Pseudomonadota bacterium]